MQDLNGVVDDFMSKIANLQLKLCYFEYDGLKTASWGYSFMFWA